MSEGNTKKILIFSLAYYPKHVGGAEVAIKEITDRLPREEFEFHMVTNRYDSSLKVVEQVGNVLVHRIGLTKKNPTMSDLRRFPLHLNKLFYQFLALRKAKELHKAYRYDGVWAMMAHATGVPAGQFKKQFPDVRYVLTLQEGDPLEQIEKKMRIFGKKFGEAFTRADVLQSISTFLDTWGKRMGFSGPSFVIPNAVDVAHFSQEYSREDMSLTMAELGKQEGDVFLVTTSRLVYKNALDDVITALKDLPQNVKFVVFGEGPEKNVLVKQVQRAGLEDRVFFRGQLDREDMPRYLQACDIFIRPSRSEGMGISFVEAMAAGLPVIATQVGGIADFLFDAKRNLEKNPTGFAIDANSPKQITEKVRHIIDHPEETKKTVANAKKMVAERYDWNTVARDMETKVFSRL